MSSASILLKTENVVKHFGAAPVLNGVSLEIRKGEILGLIGENGAGKSTFVKCLLGIHKPDSGTILFEGKPLTKRTPGIAGIPQEFNLVNDLTIAENIFLGREPQKFGLIDSGKMIRESGKILAKLDSSIDPRRMIDTLSVAEKQMVEIAKALSEECRLLIMDEPTTVLNQNESRILFRIMKELKEKGCSIIFISHRLQEILTICDTVAVLRDGILISKDPVSALDAPEIARRMVGRELKQMFPPKLPLSQEKPVLSVRDLSAGKAVRGVSFDLPPGITGLAGLAGAGRTELAETICGLRKRTGGTVLLRGEELAIRKPSDALDRGIVYLSEDRQGSGILTEFPVVQNITLSNLKEYCPGGFISREKENECARSYVEKFHIKTASLDTELRYLSGGNQQKVSLAKCLECHPSVFLFDEPTRGVDISARSDIYTFISELAQSGVACLLISSDLEEIIGLCRRVLVMRSGELAGCVENEHVTQEEIMYLATGVK